jgi:hypothetical protein
MLAVLGWMICIATVTAGTRDYPCYRLAQAPDMDGRIAGEVWKALPEAGGFYILLGSRFAPDAGTNFALVKQTHFRAGWTEDALYLAVRCEEPAMAQVKAQPKDGDAVWNDDNIELLFHLPGVPAVIQLVANSCGARWNGIGMGPQNLWDWQAVGSAGSNEWALEIKIPFAILRNTPVNDTRWKVNIGRNLTTGPSSETLTCWPLVKGSYHDVSGFGQFVFKAAAPSPAAERTAIEQQLAAPYHTYLRATFDKMVAENRACEGLVAEVCSNAVRQTKNASLQKEAAALKATADAFVQLCASKNLSPEDMAAAIASHREGQASLPERLAELKDKLLMESLFP